MQTLVNAIAQCLDSAPDQSARELVRSLAARGVQTDKSSVNSILYRYRNAVFARDEGTPPRWRRKPSATLAQQRVLPTVMATSRSPSQHEQHVPHARPPASKARWGLAVLRKAISRLLPRPARTKTDGLAGTDRSILPLYAWQRQAIDAWQFEGYRGVVEAVTGTGKTRVGMVAIRDALSAGGVAHVLVPTIDLQEQWCRELASLFPGRDIGKRGDGHSATFSRHDVIVSVVNSARDFNVGRLPGHSLLVADECHRCGAASNAQALHHAFPRRLGLTATYAREDDGNERYLEPYFGDTCFRMGYEQAIQDEVTAHFKVALVGLDFATNAERIKYEAAAKESGHARKWLTTRGWAVDEPFGEFMKDVSLLSQDDPRRGGRDQQHTAVQKARTYLKCFTEKRRVLAESSAKVGALKELASCIRAASRTIVFTETIEAAQAAANTLCQCSIPAAALHSELDKPDRRHMLAAFAGGATRVIAAPKVLDEGIDVPEADLAIIFATSKTRRQMVQRMGRVLRRKRDGRLARFILLYVEGTSESPDNGAHESFLSEVTEVADEVRRFDSSTEWDDVILYVNAFAVPRGQPPAKMASS